MMIPDEDKIFLYECYVFMFNQNKKAPTLFTNMRLNTVFTAVMCSKKWSWHIVGISLQAYERFKSLNFREYPTKIHRGHLVPRMDTFKLLLDRDKLPMRDEPYSLEEFWEIFIPRDKVVLMTSEENKLKEIPDYYKIVNDDYEYFPSSGIGFEFTKREKDFLKNFDILNAEIIRTNPVIETVITQEGQFNYQQPRERRPPFTFEMYGIPIGAKLTWYKRPDITCEVTELNRVIYKDTIFTLEGLTQQIFIEYGITKHTSFRGLFWWLYNGRLLKTYHYGNN